MQALSQLSYGPTNRAGENCKVYQKTRKAHDIAVTVPGTPAAFESVSAEAASARPDPRDTQSQTRTPAARVAQAGASALTGSRFA